MKLLLLSIHIVNVPINLNNEIFKFVTRNLLKLPVYKEMKSPVLGTIFSNRRYNKFINWYTIIFFSNHWIHKFACSLAHRVSEVHF